MDAPEKVELFLGCRGLEGCTSSESSFRVKLYQEQGGSYVFKEETEKTHNLQNLVFTKTFILDYHFEVSQKLKFEIVSEESNHNELTIGTTFTTLGQIVGASRKQAEEGLDLLQNQRKVGKLITKYEKVTVNNQVLTMQFRAELSQSNIGWLQYFDVFGFFTSNNPVLKLYRITNDFDYALIYESEIVNNTFVPTWKEFKIKVSKLCNSDNYRPVKAQVCVRHKSQDTVFGECQFTLDELLKETNQFQLIEPGSKKPAGILRLPKVKINSTHDFLDYIRGGSQLNIVVGIDFTGSNGDPNDPRSLHALKYDGTLNEYQQAISSVCSILLNYDYDKRVLVYGFGGKPRNYPIPGVQHCFPLTGNLQNHWVSELSGIMSAYSNTLQNVELSGPTLFAPMLQEVMKLAAANKNNGSTEYTIMLIITDGEIHDMEATINCIIKSAYLPLSVIIVGVGNADFRNMDILDGDDGLQNSVGQEAERDLVQFVPFRKFKNDSEELAKHVLEEVPTQLIEYMSSQGINPMPFDISKQMSSSFAPNINELDFQKKV